MSRDWRWFLSLSLLLIFPDKRRIPLHSRAVAILAELFRQVLVFSISSLSRTGSCSTVLFVCLSRSGLPLHPLPPLAFSPRFLNPYRLAIPLVPTAPDTTLSIMTLLKCSLVHSPDLVEFPKVRESPLFPSLPRPFSLFQREALLSFPPQSTAVRPSKTHPTALFPFLPFSPEQG